MKLAEVIPFPEQLSEVNIQSRRYLGNKFRLLPELDRIINEKCKGPLHSFCDIFAGTGVVGHYFNRRFGRVIANDLLYSNYVCLYAWLSPETYNGQLIRKLLGQLNALQPKDDNYASTVFGNRYFSMDNAQKIGAIREEIEQYATQYSLNFREKSILLASLLYAMDKVANTCGHYDAYRRKLDMLGKLELRLPAIQQQINTANEIHCDDANKLVNSIACDILYIDPPYNSRQYSDTYHVLENIMQWKKVPVYGVAQKMDRSDLKSHYCLKKAPQAFDELISKAKCRYILVSYNSMGEKGNQRSNARIADEEIMASLSRYGTPEYFSFDYKCFTTGKSAFEDHRERVFFVEVK